MQCETGERKFMFLFTIAFEVVTDKNVKCHDPSQQIGSCEN